jgi:hypothetical protein
VPAAADGLGIARAVTMLPPPDTETFDRAIAAVDVTINLRWPSALETSGPWLRALAAARPTITTALAHLSHVPALDPQTWLPRPGNGQADPITVAVEILDEGHSLRRAMHRLGARTHGGTDGGRLRPCDRTGGRGADPRRRPAGGLPAGPAGGDP